MKLMLKSQLTEGWIELLALTLSGQLTFSIEFKQAAESHNNIFKMSNITLNLLNTQRIRKILNPMGKDNEQTLTPR